MKEILSASLRNKSRRDFLTFKKKKIGFNEVSDFSLITNKNVDLDPMKCYVYITYSLLTGCDLEYKIIFPVASPQMCIYPLSITSQTVVNRNILVFQQSSRLAFLLEFILSGVNVYLLG